MRRTVTNYRVQRPPRQRNGYDCGPFAAADLVSLLESDKPSALQQGDMRAWRQKMANAVRGLDNVEFVSKPRRKLGSGDEDVLDCTDSP